MRLLILLTLSSFVLLGLVACHSTDSASRAGSKSTPTPTKPNVPPPQGAPNDGVRRITTSELQALLSKGQAVVIDVRNEAAYNLGHVHGAKLIPFAQVVERSKELPRDKTIVTYCS